MTHEIDEVRLTAYALGELEGAEAAEVEAWVAKDAAARREVARIRAMAASLGAELAKEPGAALSAAQREAIARASMAPAPSLHDRHPESLRRRWYLRPWSVAAASVLVTVAAIGVSWKTRAGGEDRAGPGHAVREAPEAPPGYVRQENVRLLDEVTKNTSLESPSVAIPKLVTEGNSDGVSSEIARTPLTEGERKEMEPGAAIGLGAGSPKGSPLGGSRVAHRSMMKSAAASTPRRSEDDSLSGEAYSAFKDNAFVRAVGDEARSTFALDVDTASYANVRRFLRQGRRPDRGAVRIEELINYFDYDYPAPKRGEPLGVSVEVAQCPWAPSHQLALIGFQAKTIDKGERPKANLVFLIDVSGSMNEPNKLPLVKKALRMLVGRLANDDRVALVVYAGTSGLVLPATAARERGVLEDAIERLEAGGSTNGGQGIELAYAVARDNFIQGGVNRVILCTDGDFNVGTTSESALVELIEAKAKTGVFLTALGFGMGNLKDSTIQKLANKGNGNYGYVDGEAEAKKLLVDQVDGTLVTVAKDARIQVEFNPARVGAWRLIGYEKRVMANRDFHDDKKDAGEVGAGHSVTALYELIPPGSPDLEKLPKVDPMRYQGSVSAGAGQGSADLMTVALRWKPADGDVSTLTETKVLDDSAGKTPSRNFRWACAVAMFGMELRGGEHKGLTNWALVDELAREAKGEDPRGLRAEFVELIGLARNLMVPSK